MEELCVFCGKPFSEDNPRYSREVTIYRADGSVATGRTHITTLRCPDPPCIVSLYSHPYIPGACMCFADPELRGCFAADSDNVLLCPVHGGPEAAIVFAINMARRLQK